MARRRLGGFLSYSNSYGWGYSSDDYYYRGTWSWIYYALVGVGFLVTAIVVYCCWWRRRQQRVIVHAGAQPAVVMQQPGQQQVYTAGQNVQMQTTYTNTTSGNRLNYNAGGAA